MIPFCALNGIWTVSSRSWKLGEGQRQRQRVPTNICQRNLWAQKGGTEDLLSKIRVLARVHKIPKSIWRYYTSENGDFHLDTKLDLRKSLKFSNRSGACIVVKTMIFRSNLVDNKSSRSAPKAVVGSGRRQWFGWRNGKGR